MANRINTTVVGMTIVGKMPPVKEVPAQPLCINDLTIEQLYRLFESKRKHRSTVNQRVCEKKENQRIPCK